MRKVIINYGNKILFRYITIANSFVITTNVDHQFYKAGFLEERIFATQGDYGLIQCSRGCHKKLYDNEELIYKMINKQQDCKIPTELVPKCPMCGQNMEVNLRCDNFFIEDSKWHESCDNYQNFLINNSNLNILELCNNSIKYRDMSFHKSEKTMIMRSLMNIRMPKPIWKKFLKVQDEFLQEESRKRGIVKLNDIPTLKVQYGLENKYYKAIENGIKSIAFYCISTGEFHFQNDEAAKIAIDEVTKFLSCYYNKLDRVIFNVFKGYDQEIYEKLLINNFKKWNFI